MSLSGSLRNHGYLATAMFGAGARAVSLAAQMLALVSMTWLMPKSDFGDMMTAFAIYRIMSYGIGTGFCAALVYRVARDPSDEMEIRAHRSFAIVGLIVSVAVAGALIALAPAIAEFAGKPRLGFWLVQLAPFGVSTAMVTLACGAFEGRGRINYSIFLAEFLPNILRLVLLAMLVPFKAPPVFVAYALTASLVPSAVLVLIRLLDRRVRGFYAITRWDAHYVLRYILNSLLSLQLMGIDMVVIGYLFSSSTAADYAIAGRIAALFPFFQQIVLKKFAPQCGALIAQGDAATLERESRICRIASVASVSMLTGAILIAAPFILRGAGNFEASLAMLVALAAPPFARSFFAGGEAILRMSGQAGFSLAIMAASFLFVVATPFLAVGWLGIFALPLGMTLSAIVLNPIMIARIRRQFGFWLLAPGDIVPLVGGLAFIALATSFAAPDFGRWLVIGPVVAAPGALIALFHYSRMRTQSDNVVRGSAS